jgi:hypothetical protein
LNDIQRILLITRLSGARVLVARHFSRMNLRRWIEVRVR